VYIFVFCFVIFFCNFLVEIIGSIVTPRHATTLLVSQSSLLRSSLGCLHLPTRLERTLVRMTFFFLIFIRIIMKDALLL
jgi:hypothetical protein